MRQDRGADNKGGREKTTGRVVLAAAMAVCGWCAVVVGQEEASQTVQATEMDALLDVLAYVESSNNPDAVGDHGQAWGAYQIHQAYWEEGTRLLGVDWPRRDAFDADKARRVVRAYLLHYGGGKTLTDMARIHNGGPCGFRRSSTLSYARRVAELLAQRPQAYRRISGAGSDTVSPGAATLPAVSQRHGA